MGYLDNQNWERNYNAANQYGAQTKTVTLPDGKTIQAIDVGSARPPAATEIGMVSPSSGLTITGTERNAAKEAEARAIGYTPEYIASRGGINAQGYFNDTPLSGQLSAAEQKQVRKPDGSTDTYSSRKTNKRISCSRNFRG
jgi:hypothetical protein